jgi:hypothetical protein
MKRLVWLAVIGLAVPLAAQAQGSTSDPISTQLRQVLDRYATNLVAAVAPLRNRRRLERRTRTSWWEGSRPRWIFAGRRFRG